MKKYDITHTIDESGLPQFYIVRSYFLFGILIWSQQIGREGKDKPFENIEDLEEHLKYMKL